MHTDYWHTTLPPVTTGFDNNVSGVYDVVVVGGGFAGISTALHLSECGWRVLIAEKNLLGSGASTFSAGFLSNSPLKPMTPYIAKTPSNLLQFHNESLHYFLELVKKYKIECNLTKNGLVILSNKDFTNASEGNHKIDQLQSESEIVGFKKAYLKNKAYSINPLQCLHKLVNQLNINKVSIAESFEVSKITNQDKIFSVISSDNKAITTKKIVFACGTERLNKIKTLKPFLRTIFPIKSGIIVTEPLSESICSKISRNNRIFVTEGRYINYFRLTPDNRLLFGGKHNLQNEKDEQNYQYLLGKLHSFFPFAKDYKIDFHWQKPLAFNASGIPSVGKVVDNIWVINGFCGSGIANSIYSGSLLANAIAHNHTTHPIFGVGQYPIPEILHSNFMRRIIGAFIN